MTFVLNAHRIKQNLYHTLVNYSAKRLPSREEEDSASIPFKKLKESDVRDTNQKEFHG